MIILTASQAAHVRGPTTYNAALEPRQMISGLYALPEAVLTDPSHKMYWAYLSALPRLAVTVADFPIIPE